MLEEENQMGLFEIAGSAPDRMFRETVQVPPSPAKPAPSPSAREATAPSAFAKPAGKKVKPHAVVPAPAAKKVSGLVPDGDVRLTANIRQDLHLKLKIASAHRRTTIGEILEKLIEAHL